MKEREKEKENIRGIDNEEREVKRGREDSREINRGGGGEESNEK